MHPYSSDSGDRKSALTTMSVMAVGAAMAMNWLFDRLPFDLPSWLISAPSMAGCFVLLYLLMDRHAWKWRLLRSLGLSTVPCLSGRYEGTLTSTGYGDIPVELRVDQTWTRLLVRLRLPSNTSSSESVAAAVSCRGHSDAQLIYTYENRPNPGIADPDLADHTGTAILEFSKGGLTGRYFNARARTGSITLRLVPKAG